MTTEGYPSGVRLRVSSLCDDPVLVVSGDGRADLCVDLFCCAMCDGSLRTRS